MKFRDYDNYEIYEDGRIYSYWSNKFLKPSTDKKGYKQVRLYDNEGNNKNYKLHRVVLESVTRSQIPEGLQVNHIDENKSNNHINNLNLMTCKENNNWGTRNSRSAKSRINNPKVSKALTNNPKKSKAVGAYKDGKLVLTFPSTQEAQRQGFHHGSVAACCRGERKTHKGFEWSYI